MIRIALHCEKDEQGVVTLQPKLKVFSTCRNLIRTLPAMVHDKKKPEDLDTGSEDHACDALRYKFQGAVEGSATPESEMSAEDAAFLEQARKERNNLTE
jgi:hypothetical protein